MIGAHSIGGTPDNCNDKVLGSLYVRLVVDFNVFENTGEVYPKIEIVFIFLFLNIFLKYGFLS